MTDPDGTPQGLGHEHGSVGRQIAMGGISRRLDHDAGDQIGTGVGEQRLHRIGNARGEKGENVHDILGRKLEAPD